MKFKSSSKFSFSRQYFSDSSAITIVGVAPLGPSMNDLALAPAVEPEKYSNHAKEPITKVSGGTR